MRGLLIDQAWIGVQCTNRVTASREDRRERKEVDQMESKQTNKNRIRLQTIGREVTVGGREDKTIGREVTMGQRKRLT
jgi:hypothetical protein